MCRGEYSHSVLYQEHQKRKRTTSKAEYEDIVRQVAISCRVELSQRLVKCGTRSKETYKDSSLQLTWAGLRYSGSLWLASTAEPVRTRWDVRTLRQVFDHCCADEKELLDSWVRTTLNLLVMSKYKRQTGSVMSYKAIYKPTFRYLSLFESKTYCVNRDSKTDRG